MDIFYDTTNTGNDVRGMTEKVAKLMEPVPGGKYPNSPAVVQFAWGTYTFKGMVESYKETIDFFSSNGVPLRAVINLTLSAQTDVFSEGHSDAPNAAQLAPTSSFDSATSVATRGGDPSAARDLASANNLDSLRFTDGAPMAIGDGPNLQGPAAFATASAGISGGLGIGGGAGIGIGGGAGAGIGIGGGAGIRASAGFNAGAGFSAGSAFSAGAGANFSAGAGAGAGFSAGAGAGASAGFSASAGVGVSAGAFLGTSAASAGVAATAGAFAGLRVSASVRKRSFAALNVSSIRSQVTLGAPTTVTGAVFGVGGIALQEGSLGLTANVKGSVSLADTLQFGD
jgi:hypothetical protein